jgi:ligand-binding sensor domain-containing protein
MPLIKCTKTYKLLKFLYCIILFAVFINFGYAQQINQQNFTYTGYTTADGLVGNEVTKTVVDNKGFLWIATHNGLSRFDGSQFKTYTYSPNDSNGLRSIWVTDLCIDKTKTLWVTTEWGLCWYNTATDKFEYVNKKSEFTILYKAPIALGRKNNLWLVCENGLFEVDCLKKQIVKSCIGKVVNPQTVLEDNEGNVWIGTKANGLLIYRPKENKISAYSASILNSETHYMQAGLINNTLWLATSEGLLQIRKDGNIKLFDNKLDNLISNQLTSFCVLDSNKILCCTYNKRILLFNTNTLKFETEWNVKGQLPPAAFIHIQKSANNLLWLSTQTGLYKIEQAHNNFDYFVVDENNAQNFYQRVEKQNGANNNFLLFNAGANPTISLFNTAQNKKVKTTKCKSNLSSGYNRSSLVQTSTNLIYSFCNRYINCFDANLNLKYEIDVKKNIYSSCIDVAGNIWLGTSNGIVHFNTVSKIVTYFKLHFDGTETENKSFEDDFPVTGLSISKNKIWLACIKYGLFKFDIDTKTLKPFRQKFNTSYETLNRTSSVLAIGDSIWSANMSGITLFNAKENKFYNFNSTHGLNATYVHCMASNNKNLIWGRGNTGLFKFNFLKQQFINFAVPAKFDGLYDLQRVSMQGDSCIIGFTNAFGIFKNTEVLKDSSPIYITDYFVNGKQFIPRPSANIFKYFQNNMEFNFSTPNFSGLPKEIFYKLSGITEKWTSLGNKKNIVFTNLAAGKYELSITSKLISGNTFGTIDTFKFEIKAAFWQTIWFKILCLILLIGCIILIAKNRINSIRKKEKEKTKAIKMLAELETQLMRSQMNPHFIFNSLNSIQKYIWENKEEAAAEYLSSFAKLIRAILENSKKDYITLQEEFSIIKLYIDLEQRRTNNKFNYQIKIENTLIPSNILVPPLLIQPFIENAIWHGLSKKKLNGNLNILITTKNNELEFEIDDDGVGRKFGAEEIATAKTSLGVNITSQRIGLLYGKNIAADKLVFTDKQINGEAMGTTVVIKIPLKYLHA